MGMGQTIYRKYYRELKALYRENLEDGSTSTEFYNSALLLLEEMRAELLEAGIKFKWDDRLRLEISQLTDKLAELRGENEDDFLEESELEELKETEGIDGIPYLTPLLEQIARELDLARPRGTIFLSLEDLLEYIKDIEHLIYAIEVLKNGRYRIWVVQNS